jgi:hypothetical protein
LTNCVGRPYQPFFTPSEQRLFPGRLQIPDEQLATVSGAEDGSYPVLDLIGDEGHFPGEEEGDKDNNLDDPYRTKRASSMCMLAPTHRDISATFKFTRCVKDLTRLAN